MKKVAICIVVGLFLLACGCVEEKEEVEVETGNVEFLVTDKVTEDFDYVNVTFSEIRLFNQTGDNDSYISVMSENKTVDLISLNLSHINESLGVAEIEVGNYSKLWINVSNAIGVLNETKETVNISVPSGWLKIQQLHLFNIQKGNNTITVDIDLENSIHMFHGGEEYKFIPVISSIEHSHEKKLQFREHNRSKIRNMVGNREPAIDILINDGVVKNKVTLNANETYEFNASGTLDLDGDELTFSWDFGDGTNATGAVVTHSYSDGQKTYQLWLTVSDGQDEAKWHVTVKISS
ncbi:MAG: DUF4382 domain-containing protein [Thermoplasmatales archaeon]|nr:MAG: DUF4382 domain-containing protein [Thermoplasmatales archaeon]